MSVRQFVFWNTEHLLCFFVQSIFIFRTFTKVSPVSPGNTLQIKYKNFRGRTTKDNLKAVTRQKYAINGRVLSIDREINQLNNHINEVGRDRNRLIEEISGGCHDAIKWLEKFMDNNLSLFEKKWSKEFNLEENQVINIIDPDDIRIYDTTGIILKMKKSHLKKCGN